VKPVTANKEIKLVKEEDGVVLLEVPSELPVYPE
jgi:hypothetical protein